MKKVKETAESSDSERKYRTFFENSLDAIMISAQDGSIYSANPSACRMLGWTEKEICRLGRKGIVEQTSQLIDGLRIRKETGKFFGELTFIKKDGTRFPVEVSSSVFRDSGGRELTILIFRDITERKETEKALKESEKRYMELCRHLENIREEEKSQIALNLHDDLGQKLTALNLDIAWLKSRMGVQSLAVRAKFNNVSEMINDTIESIKEISTFLRPSILYDLGLVPAFDWQLKKTGEQTGIKFQFRYEPAEIIIDNHISLILFRVLQESLTNIIRHSGASAAEIDLVHVTNKIELLIKDNGIGIDRNKVNSSTSMGITGIKERVRSVAGEVSVSGEDGVGTIIKVSIPLRNKI